MRAARAPLRARSRTGRWGMLRAAVALTAIGLLSGCGEEASILPPAELEAARWDLSEQPATNARSIDLIYTTEECVRVPGEDRGAETAARFERADVETSAKAVTITVLLQPSEDAAADAEAVACGSAPVAVERTVELPEPLAGRELRDGSSSPPTVVQPP